MAEQRFQFMSPEAQRLQGTRTPEQQVTGVSQIRSTVSGGGVSAPRPIQGGITQRPDVDSSTLNAFRAISDALIDPLVEERLQQEYMEGARRQIEGEALSDIVQEQPWYSKVFGPSASVQGARTMAQMQAVERFTTEVERDMGSLRQLSPEDFGREINERMRQSADLGDARSNVAVQAKLMESYGPLIRSHTKEHFAYVQETMQQEFTNSLTTEARSMHQYMQGVTRGTVSEEDARVIMRSAQGALQPIEGQTPDSYWSGVQVATEEAMQQGNFHFVNLVQDALYEHMPADQRVKFNNDRRKYEIQTASDMSANEFSLELAQLKAMSAEGQMSPAAAWEHIGKINQRFKAMTGLDRDLIDGGSAEGIITNNMRGIIQEQRRARERAADEQSRLREIEAEALTAQQAFLGGYAKTLGDQGGDRTLTQNVAWSTVQQLMVGEQEGLVEPGKWAQTVVQAHTNDTFQVDALANRIQGGARRSIGSALNPAFREAYALYEGLRNTDQGGQGVAAAYAGEYAAQFETYFNFMQSGTIDENEAFNLTFSEAPNRQPSNQGQVQDMMDWMESNKTNPGFFKRTFGSATPLTESSQALLARQMADATAGIQDSVYGLSQEGRFGLAWEVAKGGVDIVGEHAIINGSRNNTRLKNFLAVTDEEAGLILNDVLGSKLQESGISTLRNYQINRMPDQVTETGDRVPRYWVYAEDDNHMPSTILITGEELRERIGNVDLRPDRTDSRQNFGPNPIPGM